MKFTRTRLLVMIAVSLIVIGGTGAAITYYTGLNAFFASQQYEDYQRLNQTFDNDSRYTISEQVPVTAPVTLRITATGGTITVRESRNNQVEVDFRMPYQPNEKDRPRVTTQRRHVHHRHSEYLARAHRPRESAHLEH